MIIFRADANANIGSGHIMRCLSIARALRERGAECVFAAADTGAKTLVEANAFDCHVLHSDAQKLENELPALCNYLETQRPDWVVVDSYFTTDHYLQTLGSYARIAYIDDFAEHAYPVHLIINYNISADTGRYRQLYPHATQRLLGVAYAPLRSEFQSTPHPTREYCSNLLLSTGGADPLHIGLRLLKTITRDPATSEMTTHIIVGAFHPDVGAIQRLAQAHPSIVIHQQVSKMADLMCACDIAVSAAGSTLYELCACGLPSVCYAFVDNQLQIAEAFSAARLMRYAGDFRINPENTERFIVEQIAALSRSYPLRKQLSEYMRQTIDAKGAWRIADTLLGIHTPK